MIDPLVSSHPKRGSRCFVLLSFLIPFVDTRDGRLQNTNFHTFNLCTYCTASELASA